MGQKRVMIVGASFWQVPMIKKAKELGYIVGVIDYNPHAVGIKYADQYFNKSTIDVEGVHEATKEFKADGIATVATDMPMRAIAYTCGKLGLRGIDQETAINATNKAKMIAKFEQYDVPHPWFFVIHGKDMGDIVNRLSYPCIFKPADNAASRGVIIVNNENEIVDAIKYSSSYSRYGDVIVEELLVGDEISVEAFAVHGEILVLAITDKVTTGSPYFVEMGHNQPSKFVGTFKDSILDATERAMKAVGIADGPAHVEMMITKGGPVLIELGARLGGDFITTDLVPLSTGIDMLGATIQNACGDEVNLQPTLVKASAIRYMKTDIGKIDSILHMDEANGIEGVARVEMLKEIGSDATEIRNSLDRIGYAIAQGDSVPQAIELCEQALGTVRVVIKGGV